MTPIIYTGNRGNHETGAINQGRVFGEFLTDDRATRTLRERAALQSRSMKLSMATISLTGNLQQKAAAISAAGFHCLELLESDFLQDDISPVAAGRIVSDHGLDIALYQPFRDFEGLAGQLRRDAFDRAERWFGTMNQLGCEQMLVVSSVHPEARGELDRIADDLSELGELAAKYRVKVGYEALAWGRYVRDHRSAWDVVRLADNPHVGLVLDSFHTLAAGIPVNTCSAIPADRIFFVQVADAPLMDLDLRTWSRKHRQFPGDGSLPVASFLQTVLGTGYSGPVSLEIFNDEFLERPASDVTRRGFRSLCRLLRSTPDGRGQMGNRRELAGEFEPV